MAGEAWPRRLRRATMRSARKQSIGQGRSEKESSMPRASRTSAALAFERENSRSSWPGKWSKRWPLAFKRVKLTDIGGLHFTRACGSATGREEAGTFRSPPVASAREGAHLGGGGLLLDLGFGRGFVGLPVVAGQVLVGVDRAVGGGEQGVGLHRHVGREFAGPLRLAFEADRGPVFGVAAVGGPGGRGAGLADLGGVEASRPDCGADEGPDDALEVHLGRLVVEGAFEGLGHPLEGARVLGSDRVVVGDDEAEGASDVFRDALVGAELEGHLEGEGLAGLTLGGGLGAVGSHLGEPFSWRPGPLAHRQRVPLGAAQKSPARAACTRRAGAQRRTAKGGEFVSRGIRLWPKGKFVDRSRCWPNGLGLRPRITEGNELAMGSSCGPLLARDQRISEMAGALNPRRSPAVRTCFCRPILMALLFCPPFARAYESAENVASRETGSSSTTMTWVAPRGAHALMQRALK